jgi:hypothetical protein
MGIRPMSMKALYTFLSVGMAGVCPSRSSHFVHSQAANLFLLDSHNTRATIPVTDLQGPPSERTQTEKLQDLKKLAQHYACDRGSCDDVQISYLETLEERDNDNLRLAQMISR